MKKSVSDPARVQKLCKRGPDKRSEYPKLKKDSCVAPNQHGKLQRDVLGLKRREVEIELAEARAPSRALAAKLEEAREEERKAIAREIHDEFGQALTCLKMDCSFLSRKLRADQKDLLEKVNSMMQLIDDNIQLIRDVSSQLRPGILDDFGLLSAIEWQLQSLNLHMGIKHTIDSNMDGKDLAPKIQTALFRVFQEALTNIMRHSEATEVRIQLRKDPGKGVRLRVDDNGKGIPKAAVSDANSLGILGMRERISLLGGHFRIEGKPGKGTSIVVSIPV
jgi:two-component system, NarL family, sensor histidine kinase UhpB